MTPEDAHRLGDLYDRLSSALDLPKQEAYQELIDILGDFSHDDVVFMLNVIEEDMTHEATLKPRGPALLKSSNTHVRFISRKTPASYARSPPRKLPPEAQAVIEAARLYAGANGGWAIHFARLSDALKRYDEINK